MVLTAFPAHCPTARLTLRGPADRLQSVGEIIRELYPADILVSSDEDEPVLADNDDLDDSQLALLEEVADVQRALLYAWQPRWA
jgi:hypothetical protein